MFLNGWLIQFSTLNNFKRKANKWKFAYVLNSFEFRDSCVWLFPLCTNRECGDKFAVLKQVIDVFHRTKLIVEYSIIIAPAGFWPRGQNPRRHYRNPRVIENMYGITRKNLESQEQGPQRICG